MGLEDLIAALASPPGPAATGLIRVSGRSLRTVLESGFEPKEPSAWKSWKSPRRFAGHWRLSDSSLSVPCDLLCWPTTRSYTGQPTAELHLPGSPPLLEQVLADLYRRGVRPARPGEFTLRAFLVGKIDLVQAEAVLGVIDAHDDVELRTALDQLAGGISHRLTELRADLIDLLADLEAGLDFVEEDIEFVSRGELLMRIAQAREFVDSLLQQSTSRMTSRTSPKVVLAGLPNAGKSTLFNRLAEKSLALVSADRGTTRDYLRAEISCAGLSCELIDTAGWEHGVGGISAVAQSLRADQMDRAALIVWCSASDQTEEERQRDDAMLAETAQSPISVVRIWTKCDLVSAPRSEEVFVSAHAGIGVDVLLSRIAALLTSPESRGSSWLGMTAARCRESLELARSALGRAETAAGRPSVSEELLAIDLRDALDQLGAVVGAVYTDDLLDRIFSKFCIGK